MVAAYLGSISFDSAFTKFARFITKIESSFFGGLIHVVLTDVF